ncbi:MULTISPECIES: kynureninase [Flavobacteriaceae]|uniref:Kynureninase n=2 Tax=Flavobacteriaceae TaxID=49546 RepID=A0A4Y8AVX6_9FLAO|nr:MULTISPECIES: kynureninase [Flavobacteriaceae]TEW76651.1 kynureninase [Gramella jeungdoensis]GGK51171.1 kynureninase [Lutibacter litoralis]
MNRFLEKAETLDKTDSLKSFKDKFVADPSLIYLDGNSLGKLPIKTIETTTNIIENQWGKNLIRSWNEHWIDLSKDIATKIAKIVGAQPDEIFVGDTTSLNLYKLLVASLALQKEKTEIITDDLNFPTDLYIIQGLIKQQFKNHSLKILESTDEIFMDPATVREAINKNTSLITLSLVSYKSSFLYDMKSINNLAHNKNSLVIWDLSHAAGATTIKLNETNTDMAVGCTYKYLNGGPGAPAFLYVRKHLQDKLTNPIWSWFAHQKPFDFNPNFIETSGIQKFAISTPSILSLGAIEPGLDIILDAGMSTIEVKSKKQSAFLIELIKEYLIPLKFEIASPLDESQRGSHISITHDESYRINRAMIDPRDKSTKIVIPDFRPPNLIRIGITPLYTSYLDLYEAIIRITEIVTTKEFENYSTEKLTVT